MLFLLIDAALVELCSWLAALFALKRSPQKLDSSHPGLCPLLPQICVFSVVLLISPLFRQNISSVIPKNGPCFSLQAIFPLCLHVSVSEFPFYERTESRWIQLTLKTLFQFDYSCKCFIDNKVTLRRTAGQDLGIFQGDRVIPTALSHSIVSASPLQSQDSPQLHVCVSSVTLWHWPPHLCAF